jgi:hypothetical protein
MRNTIASAVKYAAIPRPETAAAPGKNIAQRLGDRLGQMVHNRNLIASYGASVGRKLPALNLASADAPYEAISRRK